MKIMYARCQTIMKMWHYCGKAGRIPGYVISLWSDVKLKNRHGLGKLFFALLLQCAVLQTCFAFELNIAHVNDHHSNLRPFQEVLRIQGLPTRVEVGGVGRLTSLFRNAEQTATNLLKLHAGDALVGTPYFTFFKGQADAVAMSVICFDAFTLGNHEFDGGEGALRDFLDFLRADPRCLTPVLSANVFPAKGTPLNPADGPPYIQPFTIKDVAGVKIGIVGLTVRGKTQNASRPLPTTVFEEEIPAAQRAVDALKAMGVRHIIVLSHLGYKNELELAQALTDVDVVIGGDSHTLLGDFASIGLNNAQGPYPTILKNKSGQMVCIGQAWEYSKIFALMTVNFGPDGSVLSCSGRASLVVGERFQRVNAQGKWTALSDSENQAVVEFLATMPEVRVASDAPAFVASLASYDLKYDQETSVQIGHLQADQSLCLVRVPGTRNRGGTLCNDVVGQASGSDVAQVVAEAYRRAYSDGVADIGFVNAGSVRVALETDGHNDLSLTNGTAFNLQPFTNELYVVRLTGREIREALEEGVANWLDLKNSDGSHPYASGLRWSLDLTRRYGERFANIEVKSPLTQRWQSINPNEIYSLVIPDYLAQGFENYLTFGNACRQTRPGRCLTAGPVFAEQSVINYVSALPGATPADKVLTRPACEDYAHQRVTTPEGVMLRPSCGW